MKGKKYLVCSECGSDKFHIGTNGEIAMCAGCATIYDKAGRKITVDKDRTAKVILFSAYL